MNPDNDGLAELTARMSTILLDSTTIALTDIPKEVRRHLLNRLENNTDKIDIILQTRIVELFKKRTRSYANTARLGTTNQFNNIK